MYQVTRKLQPQQTKYHKALLLNYPNKDDQQRYRENIDKGHISQATPIGGLIEIHGEGGKGIDWTDGCIALQNQDMDDLFSYAEAGMEVLIIGSSRNLSEIHQLN
jgi:murein L,D-transpeptidase YafK